MIKNLLCALTSFIILLVAGISLAASKPSFDCSKAAADIEKIICDSDDLAAKDLQLSELYSAASSYFHSTHQVDFKRGQLIWLNLRNRACILDDEDISLTRKQECIASVYKERIEEITQQMKNPADINFDAALDKEIDLSSYSPKEMSSLSYFNGGDIMDGKAKLPQTCRELYTLSAGGWHYLSDTIGNVSETHAHDKCAMEVMSVQKAEVPKKSVQVNFDDPTIYSIEFSCLSEFLRCEDFFDFSQIKSFADEEKAGKLVIKQGQPFQAPIGGPLQLTTFVGGFGIAGINFNINTVVTGSFTHHGRQEALLEIIDYPDQGSYRGNSFILAYYDDAARTIRPEIIEGSPFHFSTKPLPVKSNKKIRE